MQEVELRKISRTLKIATIIEYRRSCGTPIDEEWLNGQSDRIVNGIYYSLSKKPKEIIDPNQITLDDVLKRQELEDELLKLANEPDFTHYDLYDDYGHLLSDAARYERMEEKKRVYRNCQMK